MTKPLTLFQRMLMLVLSAAVLLGFYFFHSSTQQRDNVKKTYAREVSTLGRYLSKRVFDLDQVIANFSVAYDPQTHEKGPAPLSKAPSEVQQWLAFQLRVAKHVRVADCNAPLAPGSGASINAGPPLQLKRVASRERVDEQSREGVQKPSNGEKEFCAWRPIPARLDTIFCANISLGGILEEIAADTLPRPNSLWGLGGIQQLLIIDADGLVVEQTDRRPTLLRIPEFVSLAAKGVPGSMEVEVLHEKYLLFAEPLRLPPSAVSGKEAKLFFAVMLSGDQIRRQAASIPPTWFLMCFIALALALCSSVMAKPFLVCAEERLYRRDLRWTMAIGCFAAFLIAVVPLTLMARNAAQSSLDTASEKFGRSLAGHVDDRLRNWERAVKEFGEGAKEETKAKAVCFAATEPGVSVLTLIDSQGFHRVKLSNSGEVTPFINVGDRSYFRKAQTSTGAIFDFIHSSRTRAEPAFIVAKRVSENSASPVAVAVASLHLEQLLEIPPTHAVALTDESGIVLLHSDRQSLGSTDLLSDLGMSQQRFAALRSGFFDASYRGSAVRVYLSGLEKATRWRLLVMRLEDPVETMAADIILASTACFVLWMAFLWSLAWLLERGRRLDVFISLRPSSTPASPFVLVVGALLVVVMVVLAIWYPNLTILTLAVPAIALFVWAFVFGIKSRKHVSEPSLASEPTLRSKVPSAPEPRLSSKPAPPELHSRSKPPSQPQPRSSAKPPSTSWPVARYVALILLTNGLLGLGPGFLFWSESMRQTTLYLARSDQPAKPAACSGLECPKTTVTYKSLLLESGAGEGESATAAQPAPCGIRSWLGMALWAPTAFVVHTLPSYTATKFFFGLNLGEACGQQSHAHRIHKLWGAEDVVLLISILMGAVILALVTLGVAQRLEPIRRTTTTATTKGKLRVKTGRAPNDSQKYAASELWKLQPDSHSGETIEVIDLELELGTLDSARNAREGLERALTVKCVEVWVEGDFLHFLDGWGASLEALRERSAWLRLLSVATFEYFPLQKDDFTHGVRCELVWSRCSPEERRALAHLAIQQIENPAHRVTLQALVNRGLVDGEAMQIPSPQFAEFVRARAEREAVLAHESALSTGANVVGWLVGAAVVLLSLLFHAETETALMGLLPVVSTTLPIVQRMIGGVLAIFHRPFPGFPGGGGAT
jgi:hypothetical protein